MQQGEVDTYILQYIQQGYSPAQVRQWLGHQGVPAAQLDANPWLASASGPQTQSFYAPHAAAPGYYQPAAPLQAAPASPGDAPGPTDLPEPATGSSLNMVLALILVAVVAGAGFLYVNEQGPFAKASATPTASPAPPGSTTGTTSRPSATPTSPPAAASPTPTGTAVPAPTADPSGGQETVYCDLATVKRVTITTTTSDGVTTVDYRLANGKIESATKNGEKVSYTPMIESLWLDVCGEGVIVALTVLEEEDDVELIAPEFNTEGRWYTVHGPLGEGSPKRWEKRKDGGLPYLVSESRGLSMAFGPGDPSRLEIDYDEVWQDTGFLRKEVEIKGPKAEELDGIDTATSIDDLITSPPEGYEVTVREFTIEPA